MCLFNSSTLEAEAAGGVANEPLCELEAAVTSVKAKIKFCTFNIQLKQDTRYCSSAGKGARLGQPTRDAGALRLMSRGSADSSIL